MDQIFMLHKSNPLTLSTITNILGNIDSFTAAERGGDEIGKDKPPKEVKLDKKVTFSSNLEFVELLKLISGVGSDSGCIEDQEELEEEILSPQAFAYKLPTPVIVVWNAEGKNGTPGAEENSDAPGTEDFPLVPSQKLSPEDLCKPEYDFYERCGCPEVDDVPVSDKDESYLESKVEEEEMEVKEDVLMKTSYPSKIPDNTQAGKDSIEDTNDDARDNCKDLVGIDHLRNDMRDLVHLEGGRTDSNEDLRGKATGKEIVGFDHWSTMSNIDEGGEDNLPLGAESLPIPLKRSRVPANQALPCEVSETKLEVHMGGENQEVGSGAVHIELKVTSHHHGKVEVPLEGETGDLPWTPAESGRNGGGIPWDAEIPDHPVVDQPGELDSDSDVPSVIENRAVKESSLEELTAAGLEVQFLSDRPDDMLPIHHKSAFEAEVSTEAVSNDNDDDRSINTTITGVDHLSGVDVLTRPKTGGPVHDVDLGGGGLAFVKNTSPAKSSIDENEDSRSISSVLTGIDHLSDINGQIVSDSSPRSRIDTNQDDRSMVSGMTGVDHLEMEDVTGEVTEGTKVHRTESFTSLDLKIDDTTDVPGAFKLAVKISQPDVTDGRGGGSSITINSSSYIENFAANVQAIYGVKDQSGDITHLGKSESKSDNEEPSLGEKIQQVGHTGLEADSSYHGLLGEMKGEESDYKDEEDGGDVQRAPCPVDSISITTQTDSACEELETVTRHRRHNMTSASADSGAHTTLVSNIHLGLPSSLVEVDIAVQKTTYSRAPSKHELGPHQGRPSGSNAAITNESHHDVDTDESLGQDIFRQGHTVTFGDIMSLIINFFDVIFWMSLAAAVIIFELCRGGT